MPGESRPSRSPFFVAILGVALGLVLGVGVSLIVAQRSRSSPAPEHTPEAADELPRDDEAAALGRPSRRRRGVVAMTGQQDRDPPKETGTSAVGAPPPSAEQIIAEHAERVRVHYAQRVDPIWAPLATAAYAADLKLIGQRNHFNLTQVDCRFQTCVAEVEWPNRAQAAKEFSSLLQFPYRTGCGRSIVLPEPTATDTNHPVRATVVFDCETAKTVNIPTEPVMPPLAVTQTESPPGQGPAKLTP